MARPKTKTATQSKNEYAKRNYEDLRILVKKGQKERIRLHADQKGESLNGFVNRAIDETIVRDNGSV